MDKNVVIAVNDAPDAELSAADWVEVVEQAGKPTTFILRYPLQVNEQDFPLLTDSRLDPGSKISVLAPTDEVTHCLVKGLVRGQRVHLVHGGDTSYVEVLGADTTLVMNRESTIAVWKDVADSDVVTSILTQSKYNYKNTDVETTSAQHLEDKHTLVQRDTDFRFVHRLAKRNGFFFWVDADDQGQETAHFRRPNLSDDAAATLTINLDLPAFQGLDLSWDVEYATSTEAKQMDLNSKGDIDGSVSGSPLDNLGDLALQDVAPEPRLMHLAAAVDDSGDLTSRSESVLIEAGWFIRCQAQTTLHTLGKVVRANTIVELQGLGSRHSGKYFVAGVKHLMDPSGHTMILDLWRNGWGKSGGAPGLSLPF